MGVGQTHNPQTQKPAILDDVSLNSSGFPIGLGFSDVAYLSRSTQNRHLPPGMINALAMASGTEEFISQNGTSPASLQTQLRLQRGGGTVSIDQAAGEDKRDALASIIKFW